MEEKQILSTITSIIRDDLGLDVQIDPDRSLLTTNTLDSMDWISFLTIVQEKFRVDISTADAEKHQLGVVRNLVNYLKERIRD